MLSLKPFLHREELGRESLLAAHQRMITALLEGLVNHAVRGDPKDHERFSTDIGEIQAQVFRGAFDSNELLIATGSTLKALQDYNRRAGAFAQAQSIELHKITAMLTGAIVNLSRESSTNVSRLQDLERQLETATNIEDIRILKDQLSTCLACLREEKLRQQAASHFVVSSMSEALRQAGDGPVASTTSLDPTTGLSTRPMAEGAIAVASDSTQSFFAALFVIDHLHGLNARFGRAIGDQIIMAVAQHLAQNLRPEDSVFRWSGPAFLAILQRDEAPVKVRRDLASLTNAKLEISVETRGRSVLIPISFSWLLLPVALSGGAAPTIDKLDAFLTSKVGGPT